MARINYHGVVEAVRYLPNGRVDCVRVYERRGKAFSDRILLSREEFLAGLKAGRKYVIGQRLKYMGGTFETGPAVKISGPKEDPLLGIDGREGSERDDLQGVPVF